MLSLLLLQNKKTLSIQYTISITQYDIDINTIWKL